MPYLGSTPNASFSTRTKQDFTANGSTTAFTLSSAVASANDIEVFVGNVRQEPTDAYTVNGTTLTMSEAPETGLNFYVVFKGLEENSVVPADNTISSAKIASGAVTNAKIASGISSSKLTGALPAISGAALTGINAVAGTGAFAAGCSGSTWTTANDAAIIPFNSDSGGDRFDTDNLYNTTTYKYAAPATGVYLFWYACYTGNSATVNGFSFLKNTAKVQFQQAGTRMFTWLNGSNDDHIQNGMIVIPLSSGDTMAICAAYSTTDFYTGHSQWGGCRLA
jgi:hypothetical protein